VGVDDGVLRERAEPGGLEVEDDVRDGWFTDPAEGEAGDGDAELDGGEELVNGVLELERGAGTGTAKGDELLDAGLADADQGELRSHEEAAGQDEEGHHDHAEEHPFEHSCQCNGWVAGGRQVRIVLRSTSANTQTRTRNNTDMDSPCERDGLLLSIRRLTVDDAKAAAELCTQLGYPSSADDLHERIEEMSRTTDRVAFAAVVDGQIVGWIDAAMERHLQSPASAVIGGLVVREGTRGLGIGKRLCLEVEAWARSKSVPLVRVRSQIKREDAHRFYLRDGYRKVKTSFVFEKPVL
jgi:GNAT superfamily N-acetyltransferase